MFLLLGFTKLNLQIQIYHIDLPMYHCQPSCLSHYHLHNYPTIPFHLFFTQNWSFFGFCCFYYTDAQLSWAIELAQVHNRADSIHPSGFFNLIWPLSQLLTCRGVCRRKDASAPLGSKTLFFNNSKLDSLGELLNNWRLYRIIPSLGL